MWQNVEKLKTLVLYGTVYPLATWCSHLSIVFNRLQEVLTTIWFALLLKTHAQTHAHNHAKDSSCHRKDFRGIHWKFQAFLFLNIDSEPCTSSAWNTDLFLFAVVCSRINWFLFSVSYNAYKLQHTSREQFGFILKLPTQLFVSIKTMEFSQRWQLQTTPSFLSLACFSHFFLFNILFSSR